MSCLFCRIIDQQVPAKAVYEDKNVFVFEDINPQAPLHILIVPKKHIPTVLDIAESDSELIGRMIQVAKKIAEERGVSERGFRLVMNCNSEAGQTVFHIHLHLIAGRPMQWPPG
jgi:histidine triad (HIT) family protein